VARCNTNTTANQPSKDEELVNTFRFVYTSAD
jgi:hypothetical protein